MVFTNNESHRKYWDFRPKSSFSFFLVRSVACEKENFVEFSLFWNRKKKNSTFGQSINQKRTKVLVKSTGGCFEKPPSTFLNTRPVLVPDLVNVQRTSFRNFVVSGLGTALKKKKGFVFKKGHHKLEILFFPDWIQFKKPDFNSAKSIYFGKTYASALYIPVLVKFSGWKKNRVEWLLLGSLPLLTKEGHFIINGIPRVVLHQLIRNPGIYVISKDSRTRLPTIRIVPEQGSWINITVDKKIRFWITTRLLRRKVSLLIFLQALGISFFDLFKKTGHADVLETSFVPKLNDEPKTRHDRILLRAHLVGHPFTQNEAQRYLYAHFVEYSSQARDQEITNQTAQDFFCKTVWNAKNRSLGFLGRKQFCEKLGSSLPVTETLLTPDDFILATKASLNLLFNQQVPDDIDSLTNKRIRGCGEFLYDELNHGLQEFELVVTRKFSTISSQDSQTFWRFTRYLVSKYISKSWKSFFTSGTLSQFMDQTNPLAEITHKRRVTVLGTGGVSSKQTTIQIRGIHPTYYGRLCPIETPEGKNAGLVNSFTVYTQRNSQGMLETPLVQVFKGQVQKELKTWYVSPQTESSLILAPADLCLSKWNQVPKTELPVRKNWKFYYDLWTEITQQSIGLLQMISVATSLIPFLEHDDANRALMGSNMQRQAVPLVQPEKAFVSTGLETRVICDVNHGLRASHTGFVTSVCSRKIRLYKTKKSSILFSKNSNEFFARPAFFQNKNHIQKHKFFETTKKFSPFQTPSLTPPVLTKLTHKSSTCLYFQKNKRDLFFFSHFTFLAKKNKNHFQPGFQNPRRTLHSDSSKMIENCFNFNKVHIERMLKKRRNSGETNQFYSLQKYHPTNQSTCINQRPYCQEGEWIQLTDLLADGTASSRGKLALGKNVLLGYVPWEGYNFEDAILISEKLVEQDIFTSLHIDYYEVEVKNTQYGLETITAKIPSEIGASSDEKLRIQRLNSQGLIEIGSWVQEGDYLVGKISPLPPKGPSVQKQYEKLYNVILQRETPNCKNTSLRVPKGVQGFVLDVQILPPKEAEVLPLVPKNSILRVRIALLQKRNIQVGDKMAGRHGNKGVISKILPCQDMPYLPDGTPIDIVLNPLGVPSRMNVGQILESLLGLAGKYLNESYKIELFDEKYGAQASRSLVYSKLYQASVKTCNPWLFEPQHPGKIKVFDGRTGDCFDQPVTVGYAYMLKLIHLVDDKIHARSTGPYSAVTQQPVRGRARNGGQRLGEMEVWALQAYGAAYTLQELLTIKSDDIDGRKDTVFRIYTNQPLKLGQPESFKVVLRELQSLCFNLNISKYNEKNQTLELANLKTLEDF